MSKVTHILTHGHQAVPNRPDHPMQKAVLYRASDGLMIGQANDTLVQFGENPQAGQMRNFMDHKHAVTFLRKIADRDWAAENGEDPTAPDFLKRVASGYAANIEERDSESRVIAATNLAQAAILRH